jgi:glc operon protein GlcG
MLDFDSALKVVNAARAFASSHNWPCSIAVVDDGGWTLVQARMDGAPVVAGTELANGKARTAALFKRPTDDLETAVNSGRIAAVTAGLVMMKGGQPIKQGDQVIGAVGISADTPAHDDEIALAALRAIDE